MTEVVVVGAGGFGRETLDVVEALARAGERLTVRGVADDAPSPDALARLARRGVPYLGTVEDALQTVRGARWTVGVGAPAVRERVVGRLSAAGARACTLVHPAAVLGSGVTLGEGSVVCAGAQISTEVVLGSWNHVNPGAVVGHDAACDPFVSLNPGCVVSGAVRLGRGVLVGAGAVVLQGLRVGAGSTVGAAACVTRDVPPNSVVKGVPAR